MNFASIVFLAFFPTALIVTWTIRSDRLRHIWLLGASYVFYGAWDWRFLGLIWFISVIAYVGAAISESWRQQGKDDHVILTITVAFLLLPLGFFKYFNFFAQSTNDLLTFVGFQPSWTLVNIILPVGISFYTFQAISYVVDASRGNTPTEPDFVKVALFIAFFPQLVAGPIVRSTEFLPQLNRRWKGPSSLEVASALLRFSWGFFKKIFIADRLAISVVDPIFADPSIASPELLVIAAFAFGLLIYADFSAYSDMAIACGRLLGYRLPENFLSPYTATSVREFWRRWHVSLSRWIRDYVYIPLGGSRSPGILKRFLNLIVAMGLCGLWHGAEWTFVLWGLWHGVALVIERFIAKVRPQISLLTSITGYIVTYIVVLLGWVIFRAQEIKIISAYTKGLVFPSNDGASAPLALIGFVLISAVLVHAEQIVLRLGAAQWFSRDKRISVTIFLTSLAMVLVITMLFFTYPEQGQRNFIYFQF